MSCSGLRYSGCGGVCATLWSGYPRSPALRWLRRSRVERRIQGMWMRQNSRAAWRASRLTRSSLLWSWMLFRTTAIYRPLLRVLPRALVAAGKASARDRESAGGKSSSTQCSSISTRRCFVTDSFQMCRRSSVGSLGKRVKTASVLRV